MDTFRKPRKKDLEMIENNEDVSKYPDPKDVLKSRYRSLDLSSFYFSPCSLPLFLIMWLIG